MKTPRLILKFGLLAVLLTSACAPSVNSPTPAPLAATPTGSTASVAQVTVTPEVTVTSAITPIATSRGPNLEATDPATVKLDSGGLLLVEFFRFT